MPLRAFWLGPESQNATEDHIDFTCAAQKRCGERAEVSDGRRRVKYNCLVNLLAGLSGLNAAVTMTRTLRDGLKAGSIKPEEIAGRIGEIYDYICDSKDALVDAKDEISKLSADLDVLKTSFAERTAMVFRNGAYRQDMFHSATCVGRRNIMRSISRC